jgi:dephospho-CoA kinase
MLDAILLCGRSCAGKTTGGQLLSAALGQPHCEASHYMRRYWHALGRPGESADDFALRSLSDDVTRVPAEILAECNRDQITLAIITGLRAPEEIAVVQAACRVSILVWVDCVPAVRFERAQLRDRSDTPSSFDQLAAKDALQDAMGLARLYNELNPIRISNEGSLTQYQAQLIGVAGIVSP